MKKATKSKPTLERVVTPMEPLAVTIKEAMRLTALPHRSLYRELERGTIKAVKRGTRTVVLMDSLRAYLVSLPPATFGSKRAA